MSFIQRQLPFSTWYVCMLSLLASQLPLLGKSWAVLSNYKAFVMVQLSLGFETLSEISQVFNNIFNNSALERAIERLLIKGKWPDSRSQAPAMCHVVISSWVFVWWTSLQKFSYSKELRLESWKLLPWERSEKYVYMLVHAKATREMSDLWNRNQFSVVYHF